LCRDNRESLRLLNTTHVSAVAPMKPLEQSRNLMSQVELETKVGADRPINLMEKNHG
jgi:hypothetical protein